MTPVRLEPVASGSRVKHSTTEPLRSRVEKNDMRKQLLQQEILKHMLDIIYAKSTVYDRILIVGIELLK